jgi:5-methylcytosine-specific restriction enzyme A
VSRHRLPQDGGHVRPSALPKGPHGLPYCRCGCGREVQPPRRTFFEQACVDEWRAKHLWPSDVRRMLLERDKGVCALCGIDCEDAKARIRALFQRLKGVPELNARAWVYSYREPSEEVLKHPLVSELWVLMQRAGASPSYRSGTLWHADHITPVCEGGGECGIDNYRILCLRCHKAETAALAKRRAEAKRRLRHKAGCHDL